MSFTSYDNYAELSNGWGGQITVWYKEVGLSTLAFITSATHCPYYGTYAESGLFSISYGSFNTGVTYYATYPTGYKTCIPNAGTSLTQFAINGVNSDSIAGIGSFLGGSETTCYYESTAVAGTFTPSLDGYTFTPTFEDNTTGIGAIVFTAEEEEEGTTYVDITGTINGTSSVSGAATTGIRIDPPSQTYWYDGGAGASFYYRLWIQSDGSYGDHPPIGIENVDYEVLAGYLPNFINTNRRLIAATRNSIYYEDI